MVYWAMAQQLAEVGRAIPAPKESSVTHQIPTVAKIKYIEGDLKARQTCMANPRVDPEIMKVWEYQVEVLEAMLDDYRQIAKNNRP